MSEDTGYISSGSFRLEPLKAHNWMPWKRRMLAVLRDQGLAKYLTEDIPARIKSDEPTESEVAIEKKWQEADAKTQARIELAISDAEMVHIMGATTAKEMWEQLTTVKESKGRLGLLATRRTLYRAAAEEGFNMAEHVAKLRQLQEELHLMDHKVPDEDFVMILITSLPESWDTYTTSFLGSSSTKKDTLIKSQELVRILIEEAHRRKEKDTSGSGVAMYTKGKGSGGKGGVECFNCHKKGHMKKDCWAKGGGREGQGPKGRKGKDRSNQAIDTNLNDIACMAYEEPTEFACMAISTLNNTRDISNYDWLLDSGTTSHICPIREAFTDYVPLKNSSVQGVGTAAITAGRGTVMVNFSVNGKTLRHQLRDVLHVPEAPNCLYLVSRLDESGGFAELKQGMATIRSKDGKVVGVGQKKDRLYVLKARAQLQTEKANLAASPKLTWDQIHRR
ncbi:hypothetical protein NLJ89_g10085 [Agrocybe chaxingu]|uniref:CCHC-type domain-containing protein n=1 Tax=Agrocybe chaxingu TaxID=84603 RepID=A0A9W8JPI0_9AGAR|nr:hypothetical protein NLJ89_g10085 [Agrocybe chaxingu]